MEVPVQFPTATSCKGDSLGSCLEDSVPTPPSEQGPVPHLLKDAIVPHFIRALVPHDQDLQGGKDGAEGLEAAAGLATPHMASLLI